MSYEINSKLNSSFYLSIFCGFISFGKNYFLNLINTMLFSSILTIDWNNPGHQLLYPTALMPLLLRQVSQISF